MIDLRELQKKGIIKPLRNRQATSEQLQTNSDGFIEFGTKTKPSTIDHRPSTNSDPFAFLDTPTNSQQLTANSSSRLTDLDNKIYKLEQRIELLEKKLDVNQNSSQKLGPMGW